MSLIQIAIRSFTHYARTNVVLMLGIAAATAVLTGALIVGDSMRASLRELALDRLGQIDDMIVAQGFFRSQLASEIQSIDEFKSNYAIAEPAIVFPNGSVESESPFSTADGGALNRVSGVNVFGIGPRFWNLGDESLRDLPQLSGRQVIINTTLAAQLGIRNEESTDNSLTLRIPKPTQLPADSALAKKEGLIESLVELEVVRVIPDKSIGRFGMHVSQIDSPNIFLPIDLLNDALSRSALKHKDGVQANVIFLSANPGNDDPIPESSRRLFHSIKPSLEDFGLTFKDVSQLKSDSDENVFNYFSLSSDRLVLSDTLVESIKRAFPDAVEVFTYLANDIGKRHSVDVGIPFSMVSAIDIGPGFPLTDVNGNQIESLGKHDIVLNQWAADDLSAKIGEEIRIQFFEPESTHGSGVEKEAFFEVKAIAKFASPDSSFRVRRNEVTPAQFLSESPTLANDPDLTPEVPGLTDAESIERWDLPFATGDSIRQVDDEYWSDYRTTPKAFISLQRGQELWGSRFGKTTSFRIPKSAGKLANVKRKLLDQLQADNNLFGFSVIPIKQQAIAASSGSTPFDGLFLALSFFVIASSLILVSLLFRLALKQRASEVGTMLAVGLDRTSVSRILMWEMLVVSIVGALLGIIIGIAYAAVMIFGLKTWWLGAISKPILNLKISPMILAVGAFSGLLVCFLTIVFTIRGTRKNSIRQLLNCELETTQNSKLRSSRWPTRIIGILLVVSISLSIVASFLGGEPQASAFLGAGFMVLAAMLLAINQFLTRGATLTANRQLSLGQLASIAANRNPLRSTLTVGLVAVATFLIVAVSSFRLTPSIEGTAGFDLLANSDQPLFEDLDVGANSPFDSFSIRVKSGEDASCTNLYQSTQPRVLGVGQDFITSFNAVEKDFRWASINTKYSGDRKKPWMLLNQPFDDGAIPVVIDKNTANYSLKIFSTGGDYSVKFDSGESVVFRVIGFLENSILQGSLIISESNFVKIFPNVAGYRMFLIRAAAGSDGTDNLSSISSELEQRYSDQGFDAQSTTELLAKYQQVQNTYISTFQTLGALGLLLGTFGLATVQIRSVLERQKELGLMRSVGFSRAQLSKMVLLENVWLLAAGLLVGLGAALVTTLPHYLFGGASIPWLDLLFLFCVILVFGLFAAYLASRTISRLPLIQSLRV